LQAFVPEQINEIPEYGTRDADPFDRQAIEAEAWQLIRQREQRPTVEVYFPERRNNARTALMEAMTASGHLSRVEISGSLDGIKAQILSRLLNGWDEHIHPHEKDRRFTELCNELFIQRVHQHMILGMMPADTAVNETSNYPMILSGTTARSLGYRDSNLKGMVRSHYLFANNNGGYTRIFEQVSCSNSTHQASFTFLNSIGVKPDTTKPADIAVLEAPFIYHLSEHPEGVIDVVREIDALTGDGVLYGDTGARAKSNLPYEYLRQESLRRESEIENYIDGLARLEEQLDRMVADGLIDRQERDSLYHQQIKTTLDAICTLHPSYAEDTFGSAAAPYFIEASDLAAQGRFDEAEALLVEAELHKQSITFCGVEITAKQAQEKGLMIDSYGNLIKQGIESWQWKKGRCRVDNCPTRPASVMVGPCDVCSHCQKIFDSGKNPKDIYPKISKTARVGFIDTMLAPTYEENKKKAA